MWKFALLPLAAAYCSAGNTVVGDSHLGAVSLVGEGGENIDDRTDCPGGRGVVDLTNLKATLQPGGNYTLNFQATTCDTGWARLAYAYIDFNNNDVYDPSELLGVEQVDNRVVPYNVAFNFRVPCLLKGSVSGVTRMRVFVVESGVMANPCLSFAYGGVKEFSIGIVNGPCREPSKYCKAGNTVAQGSNLGEVYMLGLLPTAIRDNTNCPGGTGVIDRSNQWASVRPGSSYTVSFNVTTCDGRGYPRFAYVFIDYNWNDVYDKNELVGALSVGSGSSPIPVSLRATIPCDAVPGYTRMRILVVEGGHETDPCLTFAYGGVKEYSISVIDDPCLPAGPIAQLVI